MLTNTTDPNGAQIVYKSYDAFGRVGQTNNLDSSSNVVSQVTSNYTPNQASVHPYQSPSAFSDTETLYDGYGRSQRIAVANGQSALPWYQQDVCFNTDGQVQFQSYSYQGNGFAQATMCSGKGDTYSYDALGRVTQITHGDNSTIKYNHTGRATQITDENGVSRITQVDAFGRNTIVCELSTNNTMPGSGAPSSCGTDIAGSGFVTAYSYNLAAHQTTITQGGQTRTFVTDSLGRTVSVTEPERGTTTYSYAYNGTGLVMTRQRPQANQPSLSTFTTTTTQYDSLGRVLTVSYNDGLTPNKNFNYDTMPSGGWASQTGANLKGRLVYMGAILGSSSATWSGSLYSYDAMGRPVQIWQCSPLTCGTSQQAERSVWYNYDWAGDITLEGDTESGAIAYGRSPAGEVTSITNQTYSLTGGSGPTTLVSSVQNTSNGPANYNLGNGLSGVYRYDSLGRVNGQWICSGSTSVSCSGGTQIYGYAINWSGSQLTWSADTVLNQSTYYSYDQMNRLSSRTVTQGAANNFSYVYDRWGNRWQQNVTAGSGPSPQFTINTANNRISGYGYDAAGNVTNDGVHSYTYDAEGNTLTVDNGSTATMVYDAFNRKVHVQAAGPTEYVYDAAGRITSTWYSATSHVEGHIFWDGKQIADRSGNGETYFVHTDWVQTDRMHTGPTGAVGATWTSLPFGDGGSGNSNDAYATWDFVRFGDMDFDGESNTYRAEFRSYSPTQGRWLSPDPYDGSYDPSNPQSFNRYSYVLNDSLSATDPSGQDTCGFSSGPDGGVNISFTGLAKCLLGGFLDSLFFGGGPSFHGSLQPRPSTPDGDPYCGSSQGCLNESLGLPGGARIGPNIAGALGLPDDSCEFGACGGGMGFQNNAPAMLGPINTSAWLPYLVGLFHFPYADSSDENHRMYGTHHCGPGGGGDPNGGLDILCAAHDACYRANGVSAVDNLNPFTSGAAMGGCDRLLCASLGQYSPGSKTEALGKGQIQQVFGCGYINQ